MFCFLVLFFGVIVVLSMMDVRPSQPVCPLCLQNTSLYATPGGTRNTGYRGNRLDCPEKVLDMVSNGAPVQAMDALDHMIPRLLTNNFSTLVGYSEQCQTRV